MIASTLHSCEAQLTEIRIFSEYIVPVVPRGVGFIISMEIPTNI